MSSDPDGTIRDFGEQWTRYQDHSGFYGSAELLADVLGPLLSLSQLRGRRIADIGAGTGRFVSVFLDAGAAHVVAIEPSEAFDVLKRNTARQREAITYLQATGEAIPRTLDLDLVFAIGVLHHVADPLPIVVAVREALRPGGQFCAWLYGAEGNGAYLRILAVLRAVGRRLPRPLLGAFCHLLYWPLRAYIAVAWRLRLPLGSYGRSVLARCAPDKVRLVIFDQLNPAYAKYYTRDEAYDLFARGGYTDITLFHRHGYSWTVRATKPQGG